MIIFLFILLYCTFRNSSRIDLWSDDGNKFCRKSM